MKALLKKLTDNNILLEIVNGELKVFAGSNTLPAELIAEIRQHKEDLLKTLLQNERSDSTVSIPRVAESADYPLSSAQHSLWVMSQFAESSVAYNIPGVYTFEGDLSTQALTAAFRLLIKRHESLRTIFVRNIAGEVRQQVLEPAVADGFKLKVVNLRTNQSLLHQHILSDLSLPFDLSKDLPLRAALYLVGDDRWVFTYVMHHISSDGWSMEILVKELLTLYKTGDTDLLPSLPIQYKDFAAWQQRGLHKQDKEYWLQQLSGTLPVLQLPTDKQRPAIKTYNGDNIRRVLSADTFRAFTSVCNAAGNTLFSGLLAVVTTLLYRYSNQDDFIIGCPVAGREHPDLEQQIGCYLNTLALRMHMEDNYSFTDVLQHAKQVTLNAFAHQSYPFDQLIDELHVQRDISRSPLFDVLIDYHDNRERTITGENMLEGIKISSFELSTPPVSKFDLTFIFIDTAEGLNLLLEYNTDLFETATIERMFTHFETLAASIVENPTTEINSFNYLTEKETDLLINEFNNIPSLYEGYTNVIDLFKKQPADHIAVNNLSYKELDALSDNLAVYIKQQYQLQQDDLVGIMMERSEKVIIAMLAVLKAGAAYVPIDPEYPAARKAYIAGDAQLKALITQTDFIFDIDYYSGPVFAIDAQLETIPAANIHAPIDIPAEALAYVIYTSGSTGMPKGCAITAGNLSHYIQWADQYYFQGKTANFGLFTSISFDLSVTAIFCPLTTGGKINIYDQINQSAFIENDALKITPSHINLINELDLSATTVKTFILGGEQVNEGHISTLKSLNPDTRIFNEYGPTETTVGCIVKDISDVINDIHEPNNTTSILIGRPISNTEIFILDKQLQLLPIGIPGEIFIAGAGLAKYYLNNPALTGQKFIHHNGKRLYKTGDIARWMPDGNIQYIGRKDEQVKINGYRIELGEIENSLLSHPDITAAVVTVTKQQQLAAYYVSDTNPDVKNYLHQQLPTYMVPMYFTQLEKLPLTTNGKINKQQLPDPVPEFEYIAPTNAIEQTLVDIWQDILGKEKISITDNFFHLGGHSLTAIRVITQIQKACHIKLELKNLFSFPVLFRLADHIRESIHNDYTPIIPVTPQKDYPLSSAQRRLWILSQFRESNIAYNMPGIFNLEGTLNKQALSSAFRQLIARHESLRTIFRQNEQGEPRQIILTSSEADFNIIFHDIRAKNNNLHQLIEQDIHTPFDLSKGPLLRTTLYQLEDQRWVLTCLTHHITSDAWSMEILIEELLQFYNGKTEPDPLNIQYKDYASWQQGTYSDADKNFWLEQLSGELPILELPIDRVRPAQKTYHGGRINYPISLDVQQSFEELCRKQGETLFSGLLAVLNALLWRLTGQEDIVIGSPVAGREHPDLAGQIGFYLNTLALRSHIRSDESFTKLLANTGRNTRAALSHLAFPFDQLIEELQLSRDMSRSALFDVLIDYHDDRKNQVGALTGNQLVSDLRISRFETNIAPHSKYDLTFMFVHTANGLNLLLEYNADIFQPDTIHRLSQHFEGFIATVIEHPDKSIDQLNFITKKEIARLTDEFNNIPSLYEGYINVIDLFKKQPADHIAVNNLSYKELDALSDNLAVYIKQEYQLQQDDLVGIMMERSEKVIIAMLAVLKAGAAYVPIDPEYPAARKAYIAGDAQLKALITQTDFIFDIDYYSGPVFAIDAQLETIPAANMHASIAIPAEALAYVIYTSGSTGLPKGCAITAGNLSHYIQWADQYYFQGRPANFGLFTSISFDLSVTAIFCPLTTGGKINIYEQMDQSAFIENDALKITPSHINLINELHLTATSVKTFILGGEQVNEGHISTLKSLNPDTRIFNEYGPTETTVGCIVKDISDAINDIHESNNTTSILIGKPISNTEIFILDKQLQLLPIGITGEIFIAGAGLAKYYLNNPALTGQKFIHHNGKRLYKTGDIARWLPDGNIQYIGRKDEQVKINGYRIELGEIENSLLSHPDITAAVVTVTKQNQLAAYYVSDTNPDVKSYLHQQLPAYMVPMYFTQLEKLPLTTNGKINKQQLPDPVPEFEYIAPTNSTEQTFVNIWQDVLGKEQIGITDNFFHLGGDSIKVLRMLAAVRKELNLDIAVADVYKSNTISELLNNNIYTNQDAAKEKDAEQEALLLSAFEILKANIPAHIEDIYPMSDIVKGMLFESIIHQDTGIYHDQMVHQRIFPNFDKQTFETALQLLSDKHEILRTSFQLDQEVQLVHKKIKAVLHYEDLSSIPRPVQEEEIRTFLSQEMKRPFDITKAPLWNMTAFNLGKDEIIFVFQCHHAIIDGWSDALLMTELNNLYLKLLKTPGYIPEKLKVSYKDFVIRQELDKKDTSIRKFWKSELEDYNRLQLFTPKASLQLKRYHADAALLQQLEAFAATSQTSIKTVSLSAYLYTLSVISAEQNVLTGLVSNMRPNIEGSDQLLGCFLNTIPFKLSFSKDLTSQQLIHAVQDKMIILKSYERLSMAEIAGIHNQSSTGANPFFDVLFDFVDFHAYKHIEEATTVDHTDFPALNVEGGVDLTNTFLDFMVNRTRGQYVLTIRITRELKSGLDTDKIAEIYFSILRHLMDNPDAPIEQANYISDADQKLLTHTFNNTPSLYTSYTSVIDLFKKQPADNIAVNNLSYKELDELSDSLALYLKQEYKLQQDDLVGIMMERSEKVIIAILAILKAGAAYVPIDPVYPAARKKYIANDAQLKALITQTDIIFDIDYYNGPVFAIDAQLETIPAANIHAPIVIPADALAYVIYTSGSTGQPKGCAITAGNLSHYIQWADQYYFDHQPANFGLFTSISFDLSVTAIFCPLTTGGKINIYEQMDENAFNENDVLKITPSHINLIKELDITTTNVNTFILGGEQVNEEHIRILKSLNPDIKIFNEYGPTEATVGCIVKEITNTHDILIGTPISNTEIFILDNHLDLLPIGVPGEVFIGGAGLAKHYLNNPTLTGQKFIHHNGKRLYKTGDIARWLPNGEIQYIGRKDEQVKIRGYRIELGEVENSLLSHPEISAAVVTVTGKQELAAWYVSDTNPDVKSYLQQYLPFYMIPMYFTQLTQLPLTANGKIDKKQLPDPVQELPYIAPITQTEQDLALIWQDILGIERVSLNDNFFDRGGHSLMAIRLVAQLQKKFNIKVDLKEIFNHGLLSEQAKLIEQSTISIYSAIPAVARKSDYPLSSAQHRLWILSQFKESHVAYNMPGVCLLEGSLDINTLRRTFSLLIERHESLRTIFREVEPGHPRQVILAPAAVNFQLTVAEVNEAEADHLIEHQFSLPFDLRNGPLLRAGLYQLSGSKWILTYVMHHIISDGWSMEILIKEVFECYNALLSGRKAVLPPLSIQYKDYASWQQNTQHTADKKYWLQQLSGELPVLQLPTDHIRPALKTFNGHRIIRPLNSNLSASLNNLCKHHNATLFMGLLSAVTALLYRYSGQQDIIIGSPIAGRDHADLENQIGFYLNTLALRLQLKEGGSFTDLLTQTKHVTLGAYDHQLYPFDQLTADLELKRDLSRSPLFDVLIDYNNTTSFAQNLQLQGLNVSAYSRVAPAISKYDLTFMFMESASGLSLLLEYNTDLFEAATINRMFGHIETFIAAAVENPDKSIEELNFITDKEGALLTAEFNNIPSLYEGYISLIDLFKKQPANNIAVNNLSYKELDALSDNLAAYLKQQYQLQQDDLVGIMMERSEKVIIAMLAVLKAGAAYVPIDPEYPAARKAYIAGDAQLKALITQTDFIFDIDYYSGPVFAIDAQLETIPPANIHAPIAIPAEALAYVIYTSGSTGMPKGCAITAGNLSHYIQWADQYYFQGKTANFGLFTSISFDLSVTAIFCPLTTGGKINIYDQMDQSAFIENDALKITPSHINLINELHLSATSVKTFILGGEQVNEGHISTLKSLNPDTRIFNEYGPTETTVGCIVKDISDAINDIHKPNNTTSILIGKPISNTEIFILDKQLQLLPIGIPGEIFIAGAGLAKYYLNNPALTGQKFIHHNGKRLYKTGDIARWMPDGNIQYIGRKDEQVKINGYRIELGEVENSLLFHPDITAAVVTVTKQNQLAAYYVSDTNPDVKSYLQQQLPAYMVPMYFTQLEKLPLTTNGKINKQQLPDPVPEFEYIAPTNSTEQTFVNIWQDVLGKEQIGITDNFFHLGGDSIKVLRMLAAVRKKLNLEISIGDVYKYNSISELLQNASNIKQQHELEASILAEFEKLKINLPADVEDIYPMSDIERGMIFESIIHQDKGMYHDQMVHQRIFPHFDKLRFEHALLLLSNKHEILRTSFNLNDYEKEVQLVHKNFRPALYYKDLTTLSREDQESLISTFLSDEMRRPFNIQEPGLWRLAAFNLGNGEVVFVFQCHHAIIDGWSDALLMTELNNLYLKLADEPNFIPEKLKTSYKDFIIHHEINKRDKYLREFWAGELKDTQRLDIFTNESTFQLNHYQLDPALSTALDGAAAKLNVTTKAISFSAYLYLLSILNYEQEIVSGMVSNMRPNLEDSDQLLGCFLNTIPFRLDISEGSTGMEIIRQVQEKINFLKDKETLSLLDIAGLHNKASKDTNPFFDVLFDYVDFHIFGDIKEDLPNTKLPALQVTGGVDLTNTFLDCMINRTGGNFILTLRLTRKLKSGFHIDQLARIMFNILEHLVLHPSQTLTQDVYMDKTEQELLQQTFNDTSVLYNGYRSIIDLFKMQVTATPAATALLFEDAALNYQQVDELSDRLAFYLKATYHIQQDDLIGIMMERSDKMVIGILAILKAGAAYVPVDPAYPAARKQYIILDAQLKLLITQTDYIFDLSYFNGPVFAIDSQLDALPASGNIQSDIVPDQLAYVIYTSGSTGQPKGVAITAGNLSHYIQWAAQYYFNNQPSHFGLFTSISFDLSVTSVFCPLVSGGSLTIFSQQADITDILQQTFSVATIINAVKLTPSHVNLLSQLELTETNVSTAILGGEQVSINHVRALKLISPSIAVYNEYGPTEATVGCIVKELDTQSPVYIGKPISNTGIYILRAGDQLSPIGITGEILISGAGLAKQYINNPLLTTHKFIVLNGKRLYRTGDLGRWLPGGEIQYLGRKDEQLKIRGYRIEPGEIEHALQSFPDISTAVVTVFEAPNSEKELVAYFVSSQKTDIINLKTYLSTLLPEYLVPVYYVQLPGIPVNTNGKIDKRALPVPDTGIHTGTPYVAPSNETESQLVSIWEETLGISNIGIQHNFFEVGGHSLAAIRIMFRIRNEFKVELKIETLFNNATIEGIAQEIARKQWATLSNSIADNNEKSTLTI